MIITLLVLRSHSYSHNKNRGCSSTWAPLLPTATPNVRHPKISTSVYFLGLTEANSDSVSPDNDKEDQLKRDIENEKAK